MPIVSPMWQRTRWSWTSGRWRLRIQALRLRFPVAEIADEAMATPGGATRRDLLQALSRRREGLGMTDYRDCSTTLPRQGGGTASYTRSAPSRAVVGMAACRYDGWANCLTHLSHGVTQLTAIPS
jgi:hypothetical protein